jgi:hypothetical protein
LSLNKPVQISTCTETLTPASDDHHSDVIILFRSFKGIDQLILHSLTKGIEYLGPIQIEKGNSFIFDQFNILIFHGSLSPLGRAEKGSSPFPVSSGTHTDHCNLEPVLLSFDPKKLIVINPTKVRV